MQTPREAPRRRVVAEEQQPGVRIWELGCGHEVRVVNDVEPRPIVCLVCEVDA